MGIGHGCISIYPRIFGKSILITLTYKWMGFQYIKSFLGNDMWLGFIRIVIGNSTTDEMIRDFSKKYK
jgi:hypothetical protein